MVKQPVKTVSAYTSISLYKADQRQVEELENSKTFRTFNDHSQVYPFQQPFGHLLEMNDVFLAPGQKMHYDGGYHQQQIILPVSGGLHYNDGGSLYKPLYPEQVIFPDDHDIIIKNTSEKETANFLHWRLKNKHTVAAKPHLQDLNFSDFNQVVPLDKQTGGIGIYKRRTKDTYQVKQRGNGLFVFVINGAFEIENRLMGPRDGLALRDREEISFEALSELSIILLLEQKYSV